MARQAPLTWSRHIRIVLTMSNPACAHKNWFYDQEALSNWFVHMHVMVVPVTLIASSLRRKRKVRESPMHDTSTPPRRTASGTTTLCKAIHTRKGRWEDECTFGHHEYIRKSTSKRMLEVSIEDVRIM